MSAASTKVKGVSFTNLSDSMRPELGTRVWDVADYVIPPQVRMAAFISHLYRISNLLSPFPGTIHFLFKVKDIRNHYPSVNQ